MLVRQKCLSTFCNKAFRDGVKIHLLGKAVAGVKFKRWRPTGKSQLVFISKTLVRRERQHSSITQPAQVIKRFQGNAGKKDSSFRDILPVVLEYLVPQGLSITLRRHWAVLE